MLYGLKQYKLRSCMQPLSKVLKKEFKLHKNTHYTIHSGVYCFNESKSIQCMTSRLRHSTVDMLKNHDSTRQSMDIHSLQGVSGFSSCGHLFGQFVADVIKQPGKQSLERTPIFLKPLLRHLHDLSILLDCPLVAHESTRFPAKTNYTAKHRRYLSKNGFIWLI